MNDTKFEYSQEVLDELDDLGPAELQLVGLDGNAFSIIGAVKRAMRAAGFSAKAQGEMVEAAMSGDYNNVLQTAMKWTESPEADEDDDTLRTCAVCGTEDEEGYMVPRAGSWYCEDCYEETF